MQNDDFHSSSTIDYDKIKDTYDQVRTGDPEMVHQILAGVKLQTHSLVLDVGCGTANNTLLFQRVTGNTTIGLNLSYGMLSKAVKKISGLPFVQSPAENLPFTKNTFDFIFMTEVLHHLDDLELSLAEIYRVLKPDCWACIVTQSHTQIEHRMTSRFFPATIAIDKARYPRIDVLEEILLTTGFNDVRTLSYEFSPVGFGTEYLQTIEMRGYSMLHKISDEAYKRGVKALKSVLSHGEDLLYAAQYTFVWAGK
jgi:SAM-dependent methyltransferase